VHRLLADAARDVPDTVAVRDGSRELSWSQLATVVDDVARGLVQFAPDRVVLRCRGGLDALVVALATWRLGVVLEVVDPTLGRAARSRVQGLDDDSSGEDGADDEEGAAGMDDGGDRVADRAGDDVGDGESSEVVVLVVDALERVARSGVSAVVVADVARVLDRRTGRGRLRRFLEGRGPRLPGRVRLSTLVARAGQASLRPVDPDHDALVLHTAAGPVVATQRQLVASAFQVRLWIPDMATGTEVVAASRAWWQPGGWVLGPILAALTGATCQVADADLVGATIPGATIAFATPAAWADLVGGRGWRAAIGRRRPPAPLTSLRVAGVLLDPGTTTLERPLVDRLLEATEGARVRHAWQPATAVGPVLAQPLYGRFHGDPGALPLPDTVLANHGGRAWAHGPQLVATTPDGWVDLDDPTIPLGALDPDHDGPGPDGPVDTDDPSGPNAPSSDPEPDSESDPEAVTEREPDTGSGTGSDTGSGDAPIDPRSAGA